MKSTVEEIRQRFDADVERFSTLETGQSATVDAPLADPIRTILVHPLLSDRRFFVGTEEPHEPLGGWNSGKCSADSGGADLGLLPAGSAHLPSSHPGPDANGAGSFPGP